MQHTTAFFRAISALCCMLALAACTSGRMPAASTPPPGAALRAQRTLDLAAGTLELMLQGEDGPALRDALTRSRAVLIAPRMVKASFVFGGAGGNAVLAAHHANGGWSAPAFMHLAGGSAGFQAGVSETAFVLAVLDEPTYQALLENGFTFDAEALVARPGHGREKQLSSMTYDGGAAYFSLVDGLFAGVALDGTIIQADKDANEAVYAPGATPRSITDSGDVLPAPWASRLLRLLPGPTI